MFWTIVGVVIAALLLYVFVSLHRSGKLAVIAGSLAALAFCWSLIRWQMIHEYWWLIRPLGVWWVLGIIITTIVIILFEKIPVWVGWIVLALSVLAPFGDLFSGSVWDWPTWLIVIVCVVVFGAFLSELEWKWVGVITGLAAIILTVSLAFGPLATTGNPTAMSTTDTSTSSASVESTSSASSSLSASSSSSVSASASSTSASTVTPSATTSVSTTRSSVSPTKASTAPAKLVIRQGKGDIVDTNGKLVSLPWVDTDAGVPDGDSTTNPRTSSMTKFLDLPTDCKTKLLIGWPDLVDCIGNGAANAWYRDGITQRSAIYGGPDWNGIVTMATAERKLPAGTMPPLAIELYGKKVALTDSQARDAVRQLAKTRLTDAQIDKLPVVRRPGNGFVNTWGEKDHSGNRMTTFTDYQDEVRLSLVPLVVKDGKVIGMEKDYKWGIFADCWNLHWVPQQVPPPGKAPVCPSNTPLAGKPVPPSGMEGCTPPASTPATPTAPPSTSSTATPPPSTSSTPPPPPPPPPSTTTSTRPPSCPWPLTNGKCLQPKDSDAGAGHQGHVPTSVQGSNPPLPATTAAPPKVSSPAPKDTYTAPPAPTPTPKATTSRSIPATTANPKPSGGTTSVHPACPNPDNPACG